MTLLIASVGQMLNGGGCTSCTGEHSAAVYPVLTECGMWSHESVCLAEERHHPGASKQPEDRG